MGIYFQDKYGVSRHDIPELRKTKESIKQAVDKHVIGERVRPRMGGREVSEGESVTIDLENNMKESLIFIEDNAKYGLQKDQTLALYGGDKK